MTAPNPSRKREAIGLPEPDLTAYLATAQDIQRIMSEGVMPDGSIRPETLRALLKAKGVEIRAVAELYGVSDQYFHQVINRTRRDRRVEDHLADQLGLQADRIWGRKGLGAA